MKTTSRLLFGLLALFVLGACAKTEGDGNSQAPLASEKILEGKSDQEVMDLKYDQAILVCRLWSQHASSLDLSRRPNQSVTWDFLNDQAAAINGRKTLELSSSIGKQNLAIEMKASVALVNTEFAAPHGGVYRARYSPKITLDVQEQENRFDGPQGTDGHSGSSQAEVFEQRPEVIFDDSHSQAPDPLTYFNHLECVTQTKFRPGFAEQLKHVQ